MVASANQTGSKILESNCLIGCISSTNESTNSIIPQISDLGAPYRVDFAGMRLGRCAWQRRHYDRKSTYTADFSAVDASGAYKIAWSAGAPPTLSITSDQNLLNNITTTVTDGKLRIRTKERMRPTHGIKVVISSQTLSGARLRGAVDLKASKLSAPNFFIESDGASDVILDGTVDSLAARLRGAGDLNAASLQAKVVEISLMGAADAKVNATESLSVSIKGAGDVRYSGNPKTVKKSVAGAGSVRPAK